MLLNDYQREARETAVYPAQSRIVYPALGLASEAGEVAGKIKKMIRDNYGQVTPQARSEIAKELGDVLWYIASLASDLGLSMDDIAKLNLEKLADRMQRDAIKGSGDDR